MAFIIELPKDWTIISKRALPDGRHEMKVKYKRDIITIVGNDPSDEAIQSFNDFHERRSRP